MASRQRVEKETAAPRPASTAEGRINQIISQVVDLAERQIAEGTVSSQVMAHFLKLSTARENLELRKLESEVELQKAKIEAMGSAKVMQDLYENAIAAMRMYQGQEFEYIGDE